MNQAIIESFLTDLAAEGRRPLTITAYRGDLKDFARFLKETCTDLASVADKDIRAYRRSLIERGYQPSSIARKLNCVRTFSHWAVAEELVAKDPTLRLVVARVRPPEVVYVTDEESEAMMQAARYDLTGLAVIASLTYLGERRSEALGMRWCDVDLVKLTVTIHGKGERDRTVPLIRPLAEILSVLKERSWAKPEDFVLTNRFGRPLGRTGITRIVKMYAKAAGIKKNVTPHSLRHGVATRLAQRGVSPFAIASILGHQDITMTQRYVHPDLERQRTALESLGTSARHTDSPFGPDELRMLTTLIAETRQASEQLETTSHGEWQNIPNVKEDVFFAIWEIMTRDLMSRRSSAHGTARSKSEDTANVPR